MIKQPLISVIIPLYNSEKFIGDAIKSVLNQTYINWELIVVDDASTDNSLRTARRFESERIKVLSKKNEGAAAARNFGFQQSTGEFIKFFDADDLINPEMLEAQAKLALKNRDCIISSQWGRFYDNDLSSFKLNPEECWRDLPPVEWICSSWYKGTSMTQPGMFLVPRKVIEKNGLWDENLSLIDDLEFYTKNLLGAEKVIFCASATLYYRSGNQNNLSGQKSRKAMESSFKSIELSTCYLLSRTESNRAKLCAANVWQSFLYETYPDHLDLRKKTEVYLSNLPKPDLVYSRNKIHRLIIQTFGWKFLKLLQKFRTKF